MSDDDIIKTTTKTGIPFTGVLALLFIALKLTETGIVADWSWIWVLSPLWIGPMIVVAILAVIAVMALIAAGIAIALDKRR